jgi:hypothetical protein
MICKTLSVCYEEPRPAERKALCHSTDPRLKFARGGQSSFCKDGEAHFMGQGPVVASCDTLEQDSSAPGICNT